MKKNNNNNEKVYYTVDVSKVAMLCRAILFLTICLILYFVLGYAENRLKSDDLTENIEDIREVIIFEGDTILLTNGVVDTVLKGGN